VTAPPEFSEQKIVRDPLWSAIRLDPVARRLVDTPSFQRLRRIRQLGLAYLVYPGATHTRFDHALGVYELTRRALGVLRERGDLEGVDPVDVAVAPYAGLLHDVAHFPFSHALEELPADRIPRHHEALTRRFLGRTELSAVLAEIAPDAEQRIEALVRGRSESPLQGLVSGSLDLDKIEYLRRDAFFCGVPYGAVDVERLLNALAIVRDPESGRLEVGIREKGLSALESLLFSKYQMFRNVYWHHTVRSATVVFQRMVDEALGAGLIAGDELVGETDEGVLALLARRTEEGGAGERIRDRWLPAIRDRRLPKRAVEVPGDAVRGTPLDRWFYADRELVAALEDRLAAELSLPERGLFVDYPEKPRMMGLDLPMLRGDGSIHRLTEGGRAGLIDLPRVADKLYHSARVLRIFTAERRTLDPEVVLGLLATQPDRLRQRLRDPAPLL
jgi:uncharacterized protein